MEQYEYDVVVVGGGAAGLSGAVALLRSRRRGRVVDAGRPRNAPAAGVHNLLTRDGLPPRELVAIGREEVRRYGGAVREARDRGRATRRRVHGAPRRRRATHHATPAGDLRSRRRAA